MTRHVPGDAARRAEHATAEAGEATASLTELQSRSFETSALVCEGPRPSFRSHESEVAEVALAAWGELVAQ